MAVIRTYIKSALGERIIFRLVSPCKEVLTSILMGVGDGVGHSYRKEFYLRESEFFS